MHNYRHLDQWIYPESKPRPKLMDVIAIAIGFAFAQTEIKVHKNVGTCVEFGPTQLPVGLGLGQNVKGKAYHNLLSLSLTKISMVQLLRS